MFDGEMMEFIYWSAYKLEESIYLSYGLQAVKNFSLGIDAQWKPKYREFDKIF